MNPSSEDTLSAASSSGLGRPVEAPSAGVRSVSASPDSAAATTAGLALLVAIWDAHQAILNAPRQKADNDREAMRLLEGLYALLAGLTRLEPEYDGGCDEQDGTSSREGGGDSSAGTAHMKSAARICAS